MQCDEEVGAGASLREDPIQAIWLQNFISFELMVKMRIEMNIEMFLLSRFCNLLYK